MNSTTIVDDEKNELSQKSESIQVNETEGDEPTTIRLTKTVSRSFDEKGKKMRKYVENKKGRIVFFLLLLAILYLARVGWSFYSSLASKNLILSQIIEGYRDKEKINFNRTQPTSTIKTISILNERTDQNSLNVGLVVSFLNSTTEAAVGSMLEEMKHLRGAVIYYIEEERVKFLKDSLAAKSIKFEEESVQIDATYKFLLDKTEQFEYILFTQSNSVLKNLEVLPNEMDKEAWVFYHSGVKGKLSYLELEDLYHHSDYQLSKALVVVKKALFSVISPFNFALYDRYTFHELCLYPVLALTQGTTRLKQLRTEYHMIASNFILIDSAEFELMEIPQQPTHICLVSYPSVPTQNNVPQTKSYLENLKNFAGEDNWSAVLAVLYIRGEDLTEVVQLAMELEAKGMNITLRIRYHKAVSSVQVYEAAYTYCPQSSNVMSSRTHIHPKKAIFKADTLRGVCKKSQFLVPFYENEKSEEIKLEKFTYNKKFRKSKAFFDTHLQHAQLFCSEIGRHHLVYVFQWRAFEFYESEVAFAYAMIEASKKVHFLNQSFYKVAKARKPTEQERTELKLFHLRVQHHRKDKLPFSSLSNVAFKKDAPELIPRKIHQIWLSESDEISAPRQALAKTIVNTNPEFDYRLWTYDDITVENFPFTFETIQKMLRDSEGMQKNFLAEIADIMRIEILFHHGGIYLDFKTEAFRSFLPFLRFKQWFLTMNLKKFDASHKLIKEGMLIQGCIGSIPGHPSFKKIMETKYQPERIRIGRGDFITLTGAGVIGAQYSPKQMLQEIGVVDTFSISNKRPCMYNQEEIKKRKTKANAGSFYTVEHKGKRTMMIPCELETEQYFELYVFLGRTYFKWKGPFQ